MKNSWIALKIFLWFTLVTGIAYPLLITGIAQLIMPYRANGSMLVHENKIVGSLLIGQSFTSDKYFWGRPSAVNYNPLPSGGSNFGPISVALKKAVDERKKAFNVSEVPSELLFSSASGLDPHISQETAFFQMERVMKARNLSEETIRDLINKSTEHTHVNVLKLNYLMDELQNEQQRNQAKP